jgi:hypothetical protein
MGNPYAPVKKSAWALIHVNIVTEGRLVAPGWDLRTPAFGVRVRHLLLTDNCHYFNKFMCKNQNRFNILFALEEIEISSERKVKS